MIILAYYDYYIFNYMTIYLLITTLFYTIYFATYNHHATTIYHLILYHIAYQSYITESFSSISCSNLCRVLHAFCLPSFIPAPKNMAMNYEIHFRWSQYCVKFRKKHRKKKGRSNNAPLSDTLQVVLCHLNIGWLFNHTYKTKVKSRIKITNYYFDFLKHS